MRVTYVLIICLLLSFNCQSQEIFADYFDINWGATSGIEVMGKLNLKRNKDYKAYPIPKTYQFTLLKDISNSFEIETEFDPKGRIFGVIKVKRGVTLPKQDREYSLSISLNDGDKIVGTKKDIVIHLKENTLWFQLHQNYLPYTTEISRLYGRFKYSDEDLAITIKELIKNSGKFKFSKMYGAHPADYVKLEEKRNMTTLQLRQVREKGIEGDWKNVIKHIGGLGYAYAHSKEFGLNASDSSKTALLKKAIYLSAFQFMSNVGVEGDAVLIDGSPAGPFLGDGFVTLDKYRLVSHAMTTHQWSMTDALASPLAQILPSLLKDKAEGDALALALFNEIRNYFQIFFAIVPERRIMDKHGRWGIMDDLHYSNGGWSDANISHRYRTLMLLPIVYADYNQPITYVPYWYDDFYNGTKFEGKTFVRNLSPRGVIEDLRKISELFSTSTQEYAQSGYNPDGSISHHSDHASDVAMEAYGFEWLSKNVTNGLYWYNTQKPVNIGALQFVADRFNKVYGNLIYKNRMDFTVLGRSHLANTKKFVEGEFVNIGETLLDLLPKGNKLEGKENLKDLLFDIRKNNHKRDTSMAFWNADFVLHRKESEGDRYYFSVKHKSTRTIGAEDFSEIRKSWHFGSGVFQLKINGDEYEQIKLNKWDHHAVPGVTEEWRIDAMPTGHSAASGPGLNEFSGQLADGQYAMSGYNHMPSDDYATTNALKSYFMIDNIGTALGSDIKRVRKGQQERIVTTIDQNYFDKPITYFDGKMVIVLDPKDSHDIEFSPNKMGWVHFGEKGYLLFPEKDQKIIIKTNGYVNVTNQLDSIHVLHYTGKYYLPSTNFGTSIIAIDHGVNPSNAGVDQYHYAMIANVSAADMPEQLKSYQKSYEIEKKNGIYHAIYNKENCLSQITLFNAGRVDIGKNWFESDSPALLMCKENENDVVLSISNPLHTLENKEMVIKTNLNLNPGKYQYQLKGINPKKGEYFIVSEDENTTTIVVELPDLSDAERYNYQEMMYAGSPFVVRIPKG